MKFATYLKSIAEEVEKELDESLTVWKNSIAKEYPSVSPFIEAFVDQCRGGKRIRGALVHLGYSLTGGEKVKDILQVSAAFEIFQTAILAHDDIIDKSELRRGKPSLYQALGGNHYGIAQTISLGDLGFFLATELITKSKFPDPQKYKALLFFSQTMQLTALGEILDVYSPTKETISDEDVLTIIRLKTSPYSVIGPLSIGAIFGNADEELLKKIHFYGDNLGTAYQIHDDILGIFAEEETLGKSNVSDIIEGKSTLLIWYAREHANSDQKELLDNIYGKPSLTKDEVATIQTVFRDTGAYDYAAKLVKDYTEKACSVIPELTTDPKQQELLLDIAGFLSERKK